MSLEPSSIRIRVSNAVEVSGLVLAAADPAALFVFGHGAGAGMRHTFMEGMAQALAAVGVSTLRYQFPYIEQGRRRPDPPRLLTATVRAAVESAAEHARGVPLFAGGKSMGGRMTSQAAAAATLPQVAGLVFLGFPLHPAGKPGTDRATHLAAVDVPLLFVQGTRDKLAELELLTPVVEALGTRARLHVVAGGDHSLAVPKSVARDQGAVWCDVAQVVAAWMTGVGAAQAFGDVTR